MTNFSALMMARSPGGRACVVARVTGVAAVCPEMAKLLLGPSPRGRRPAGKTRGSEEVAFRHSMACPMTQPVSHSLQDTFLYAPHVRASELAMGPWVTILLCQDITMYLLI